MINKINKKTENEVRFRFGKNWANFIDGVDESSINAAEKSLRSSLGMESFQGLRFLDAGSGSGLFSLAAARLGAKVVSFDFDLDSVETTRRIKRLHMSQNEDWQIFQGSVLDEAFLSGLGEFDVVYTWGVLHHTGNMALAMKLIESCVKSGGLLFIAIYNDQLYLSRYWLMVKKFYNTSWFGKALMLIVHAPYLVLLRMLVRKLRKESNLERGMSYWHDMVDWIGGYPFEYAKPEVIFKFYKERNFELKMLKTCAGRMGCNEFVFRKGSV